MLSLMKFHCVLQEITMMINNRPLGRFNGMDVLTPNMLILGQNYTSSPHNIEESPVANIPLGLWQYMKDVYTIWWKKWEVYILPTLFPNKTWKTPHPNIKARDVCLLHKNLPKKHVASTYKYCRVV